MADDPYLDDPDFSLIPADDPEASADDLLDAAVESALEDPLAIDPGPETVIPFGRTWAWDQDRGRFATGPYGSAPLEVSDTASLQEFVRTIARTAAGAHALLPAEFGIENPDDFIGVADPSEAAADFEERFRTACTTNHERIEEVDDFDVTWDPTLGTLTVPLFTLITDEGEAVDLLDLNVEPEV